MGHGVHCPLRSRKSSLQEATQCLCPAARSHLQRSALERAVLRSMCSFQLPPPRLAPFPCCSLRCKDSPLPWRYATRQEHRVRLRPPPPNCPASWRLVQDHRATTYALQAEHARQGRARAATPFRAGKGAAMAARRARSTSTHHNPAASQPPTTPSLTHSTTQHPMPCEGVFSDTPHSLSPFLSL